MTLPSDDVLRIELQAAERSAGRMPSPTCKFTVTNTGNTQLTNLRIDDPKVTDITCAKQDGTATTALGFDETVTCTGKYQVTQEDLDAGEVKNTATATAAVAKVSGMSYTEDTITTAPSSTTTKLTQTPGIELVKKVSTVNGIALKDGDKVKVDDKIGYTFTVKNTGNVTLTDVKISDPMIKSTGSICEFAKLTPGETTCSTEYIVTRDDFDTKTAVENSATVTGVDPAKKEQKATASAAINTDGAVTGLVVAMDAQLEDSDASGMADAGEKVKVTAKVTNVGNVSANSTQLKLNGNALVCPKTTLAPSESMTCTVAEYTITEADAQAGKAQIGIDATASAARGGDLTAGATRQIQVMTPEEKAASEQAKQDAEQAKQDAEQAKQDAEQAKQDAEQAKQDAEQAKQDAEKAKQDADNSNGDPNKSKAAAEQAQDAADKAKQDAEKAQQDADEAVYSYSGGGGGPTGFFGKS